MEIVVADETNFNYLKEEVKSFRKKYETNLWYRTKNITKKNSNCFYFIGMKSFKIFETFLCRSINFEHFIVCQMIKSSDKSTYTEKTTRITETTTPTEAKDTTTSKETTTETTIETRKIIKINHWPTWLIIVVIFSSIAFIAGIFALANWCRKVSFKLFFS